MSLKREGMIGEAIKNAKQARKMLLSYMEGLEPRDFGWRPVVDAMPRRAPEGEPNQAAKSSEAKTSGNPILWIVWHVGEVEESVLWTLEDQAPRFHFGRSALKARGQDEMPAPEEVLKYLQDVRARYLAKLEALPEEVLDQDFGEGLWRGRARGLIALPPRHETYHLGQVGYIRRLMGKPVPDVNELNPYQ